MSERTKPGALEAVSSGLSASARRPWLALLFFAVNLLVAAAVAAPMYSALREHIGPSTMGRELARGFSAAWLTEFQIARADFLSGVATAIAWAGVVFLALNTILSAGAFEVFAQGEGAGMHAFGRGVGKYFGRFIRLAVAASVLYFIAFWIWNYAADKFLDAMFRHAMREAAHFWLEWVRWGLLGLSLLVINAVVEFAKAEIVVSARRSSLAALGHAAGFVLRHFGAVLAIVITLGLLSTLAVLVYVVFARYFPQSSAVTVALWFVVAQLLLWLRWMLRLAAWAATVSYYTGHLPRVIEPQPAA
jgi:hypothetical protein